MQHAGQEILIKDAIVFLFAAGLVIPALRYCRIPSVLGFILAGIALGPIGLGSLTHQWPFLSYLTMSDPAAAAPFAELGVLFLLFLLGLELSFKKLWEMRRLVFGAGGLQASISAVLIGIVAYMIGLTAPAAALIGLALALSSTAIVMQLLIDDHRATSPAGRTGLSVLLFQDILVAPILILAGFLSRDATPALSGAILQAAFNGFAALVAILFIGHFLLRPLFRLAATTGGRDFMIATTLLTVVGAAVITASAGLSLALGAFLAGLMLGETEFKHQTEVDLEPFKSLLLGLFFMTVGMGLDLPTMFKYWPIVILGLILLLVIKLAVAIIACRIFTGKMSTALEAAFLLAPAGEFAFVVLAAGSEGGVVTPKEAALITAIAGLSMMITPLMSKIGQILAKRFDVEGEESAEGINNYSDLEGHVIIAGFGRVGQTVARILEAEQTSFVALESRPKRVNIMRKEGWRVYLGDAARKEILEKAGIQGAAMAVLTLDDAGSVEAIVRTMRTIRPQMPIIVRANDAIHARELYAAGADFVVPETIEAGLQMASRTLQEFGYDSETSRGIIAHERDREYKLATQDAKANSS
ncbi:cation:proton antiporter domain-containing protein [Hirschia baltica]|uniref:Sodium/hydrogen exchanger n=1 Tax=Hirschia baltica (strain ATCC 49814 / DSM 5838 / IFAM 1418) TaxID=582402 RepID=C6XMC5_HIRBI|nr:cation:proton antiporter [Hirschia baltica]ACT58068.1 sodium/hydrogen exchanger [Hirschia baltica ATCC 49814]